MMTTEAASRHAPFLAAGLLGAAILIVLAVFALFQQQSSETALSVEQLAAYRSELAQRPRLQAEFARIRDREAVATGLWHGASGPLAAAEIQRIVNDVVESCGGEVRSAQNLPSSRQGGLETIEVQYELSLPLATLKRAIYRLETATPFLFLDNIDLKVGDAQPAAAPATVQVQWIVRGYRRTGRS
jgi:hypothetical protein